MSWGAVAIGVGSAAAGYFGSQGAKDAAEASSSGADASAQVTRDMFNQSREDQLPWLGTGQNALRKLAALNGVPYASNNLPAGQQSLENFDWQAYNAANPDVEKNWIGHMTNPADKAYEHYQLYGKNEGRAFQYINPPGASNDASSNSPDYTDFYNSPDYQFAFSEGNRAVNAGLAARGLSGSGRAMKALTKYGQGAASTQLNNYRNALAAMAGVGQSTATNIAGQSASAANSIGSDTKAAADATASGYLGSANSWNNAINQGIGGYAYGKTNKWWG